MVLLPNELSGRMCRIPSDSGNEETEDPTYGSAKGSKDCSTLAHYDYVGEVDDSMLKEARSPKRECTHFDWDSIVDGVRYIIGDRLIGSPLDPLQRTASELKLCGSLHSVPTSLRLSPSETDICNGVGTWPPRSSALAAFNVNCSLPDATKDESRAPASAVVFRTPPTDRARSTPASGWSAWASGRSQSRCSGSCWQRKANQSMHMATASMLAGLGANSWTTLWRVWGSLYLTCDCKKRPSAMCDALREALLTTLDGVAGQQVVACVWKGRDAAASSRNADEVKVMVTERVERLRRRSSDDSDCPAYQFEFVMPEEKSFRQAKEVLQREAFLAGGLRLMPALVEELHDAGHLAVRIDLEA